MGVYKLSQTEKNVLYVKYKNKGWDQKQAGERVKKIDEQLKSLVEKLKAKGETKENINVKFKQEFYKLVEREEKERIKRNKARRFTRKK